MGKVELGKHDVGIFELPNRGATRKESNFQNGESMGIYSYAMDICCLLAGCPIALGHFFEPDHSQEIGFVSTWPHVSNVSSSAPKKQLFQH